MTSQPKFKVGDYFLYEEGGVKTPRERRERLLGIIEKTKECMRKYFWFSNEGMIIIGENLTYNSDLLEESVQKLTKDQAIDYVDSEISELEIDIETSGVSGALASRKRYDLLQRLEQMGQEDDLAALQQPLQTPNTGIYVITHSPFRSDTHPKGYGVVKATPGYSQENVARFMRGFFEKGFGSIKIVGEGHYASYIATEIPKEGLHLVKPTLEISLREL